MRCVLVWSLCTVSLLAACAPEGSSAYVSSNLPMGDGCEVSPSATDSLSVGLFDIAEDGDAKDSQQGSACRNSYYLHLLVNSSLKANANPATGRAEPNVLQVTEAEVRLFNIEEQVDIPFNGLPNPFRVKSNYTLAPTTSTAPTTGVVAVEAIPVGYHKGLGDFVGGQILADVQLFGTTTGDVDIDFKPFSYPIRICRNCLKKCLGDTLFGGKEEEEILGGQCDDHAGADGRLCLDRTCPAADSK